MKKILTLATAALLFTGAAFAHEGKQCCKKGDKKECCKKGSDSKTAKASTTKVAAKKA